MLFIFKVDALKKSGETRREDALAMSRAMFVFSRVP
jgi:hypothetical protein